VALAQVTACEKTGKSTNVVMEIALDFFNFG
jgi:hypothetical protein